MKIKAAIISLAALVGCGSVNETKEPEVRQNEVARGENETSAEESPGLSADIACETFVSSLHKPPLTAEQRAMNVSLATRTRDLLASPGTDNEEVARGLRKVADVIRRRDCEDLEIEGNGSALPRGCEPIGHNHVKQSELGEVSQWFGRFYVKFIPALRDRLFILAECGPNAGAEEIQTSIWHTRRILEQIPSYGFPAEDEERMTDAADVLLENLLLRLDKKKGESN